MTLNISDKILQWIFIKRTNMNIWFYLFYLFPADMIKTKDEIVRQALHEKQQLVAEVLHLPADDFENIAEVSHQRHLVLIQCYRM